MLLVYICALILVFRDYFRIFCDSVVVDWVMDFLLRLCVRDFSTIFIRPHLFVLSVCLLCLLLPQVYALSQACFGRSCNLCFYIIYVFFTSLS
jgi:hypothetical protein